MTANQTAISWINRPISTEIKSPAGKRPPPWSRSQSTYEFSRSASNPSATLPQSFAAIHRPSFGPSARPNWSSQIDLASCFGRPVDSSRLNRSAPPASLGLARARTLCWNYFSRGASPPRPPHVRNFLFFLNVLFKKRTKNSLVGPWNLSYSDKYRSSSCTEPPIVLFRKEPKRTSLFSEQKKCYGHPGLRYFFCFIFAWPPIFGHPGLRLFG